MDDKFRPDVFKTLEEIHLRTTADSYLDRNKDRRLSCHILPSDLELQTRCLSFLSVSSVCRRPPLRRRPSSAPRLTAPYFCSPISQLPSALQRSSHETITLRTDNPHFHTLPSRLLRTRKTWTHQRLVFWSGQSSNLFTVGAATSPTSASKVSGIPNRGGDVFVAGVAAWRLPWICVLSVGVRDSDLCAVCRPSRKEMLLSGDKTHHHPYNTTFFSRPSITSIHMSAGKAARRARFEGAWKVIKQELLDYITGEGMPKDAIEWY
ncbi:uncharacterized protein ARMOST_11419 [Armillaria ostoyae]|uniref:Uncharacterized protein n=1 Tax=Armillaria ostoyae TaxID=47428 RepID=A0A284RH31_ARMOS|nr:uncharacterized protein ARMOST_11419 [Armillaria ostoyae]